MEIEKTVLLPVVGQFGHNPLAIGLAACGTQRHEAVRIAHIPVYSAALDEVQQRLPHSAARGRYFGNRFQRLDCRLDGQVQAVALAKVLGFYRCQHRVSPAQLGASLLFDGCHAAEGLHRQVGRTVGKRCRVEPKTGRHRSKHKARQQRGGHNHQPLQSCRMVSFPFHCPTCFYCNEKANFSSGERARSAGLVPSTPSGTGIPSFRKWSTQ